MALTIPKPPATLGTADFQPSSANLSNLHHHSSVTKEFDPLRFEAAASLQLQSQLLHQSNQVEEKSTHLIASPYNDPSHLLDISALDHQDRIFALALSYLKPIRDDYATAAYTESFNWDEVFSLVKSFSDAENRPWTARSYYVVIFRSILLPDADGDRLYALDAHSHREAIASGGLLKYWFGSKNEDRRNLATCIWRTRNDAKLGGRGPWHAQARAAATVMYEEILFTTLKLDIFDGGERWELTDWKDN
ncbi:unnamed protein product [Penicillium salamii]|uniref:Uncharacterized protein n=1 Tax=Penicillium salamii TaxID=1612424 RepID=A0A9W4JF14_9EURO|nr:unnamed protein product [Penicillium salamii]CAG8096987.1 unnamed protein product [Penicillium salamii]CAG8110439.1 unnamed protein product [Penicillium salamii]CAG8123246.1 unnamed protein product [Penicillium salamii]CAG8132639.1 unnamed protein product [Penicillium salamii]